MSLWADIGQAARCKCPVCRQGRLFDRTLSVLPLCENCGAPLADNDVGDGAIVFVIFILGFLIAPLAWVVDLWFSPALWVHVALWSPVTIGLAVLALPVVKSYVMLLQYRYRPGAWKKT